MDRLLLQDVRCFRGTHSAPIAPLTLLVGENSSGKSTVLALARVAWDLAFGVDEPDFNEEPFHLGAYEEIAHYHGGQGKRAKMFSVGFSEFRRRRSGRTNETTEIKVQGSFCPAAGQPALRSLSVESGEWAIQANDGANERRVRLRTPLDTYELTLVPGMMASAGMSIRVLAHFFELLSFQHHAKAPLLEELSTQRLPTVEEIRAVNSIFESLRVKGLPRRRQPYERPISIAPVRTRPKRTYDPLREARSPEGDHVPMLLARLKSTGASLWNPLVRELSEYGKASGLFDALDVHRFADSDSSPFQLRIRLAGQKKMVNLVDVGYGVSQVLPILVDALVARRPTTFLIQQPEVHLHPRAQAELGSLLANLIGRRGHRFLIETHSDHLVDRVRLEVKSGRLDAEQVRVLFFERFGAQAAIHELAVDPSGNLVGQPPSYRQFFLEEELKMVLPAGLPAGEHVLGG